MTSRATDGVRRVCVTGGAGFIGSRLVNELVKRNLEVTVIDDLSVGKPENVAGGAELVVGNVLDREAIARAVTGCDVVLHLAARVAIRSSFEFVVEDAQTNVVGTASVLRAAAEAGARRVVATSSMAVYAEAPTSAPIDESHPTEPISPYGISKLATERLTHSFCRNAGMESVVLRLFNTFGPGQALSPYVGVTTIFATQLRRGETPTIYGDGEQCRDFVHVDDVVSGFVSATDSPCSGETLNIGSGVATSINTLFDYVRSALASNLKPRYADAVAGELRYSVANVGKATRLLDYRPRRELRSTIRPVVAELVGM